MTITLKDVAREAGVSASAVSRSFTPGAPVSEDTRARVVRTAARLGYQPNRLAAGLTNGKTRLVGIVADDLANPFYLPVLDQLSCGLQARGLRPLLINLKGEPDAVETLRQLRTYSVEAAILISASLSVPFLRALKASGLPLVHAFARAHPQPELAQTGINDAASGRMAAKTLFERGYMRTGFIGGPELATPTRDRFAGFRNMAAKQEQQVQTAFAADFSYSGGHAAMQEMLRDGVPEALFCADDVLALGAIAALREAGHKVPEDVGVMGMGDIEMARWDGIALTTIAQPVSEIVAACVELVELRIADPEAEPTARTFTAQLVERGTLRPLPGA